MAASESQLLAPQEIMGPQEKARGELVGEEERTETDRKRERRKKKAKQGAIFRLVTLEWSTTILSIGQVNGMAYLMVQ